MPTSEYAKQLFKKDGKLFRKYIENTTANGVVRIFSGKSVIRRLFWLVVVLGATVGCLHNVINRIVFLANQPTSTTFTLTRQGDLTFPAVTICNLNQYRREQVMAINPNLGRVLWEIYYTDPTNQSENFECEDMIQEFSQAEGLQNLTLKGLQQASRNPPEELIAGCLFAGRSCNSSDFAQIFTDSGFCYTFNSREGSRPLLKASSTGTRAGLQVLLNINQSQYVATNNLDAGVKLVVHPQDEPPRPEDVGIGAPPGTNAFMGIRERRVVDMSTKRECRDRLDTTDFNFLGEMYNYSISSCAYDCLLTRTAEMCNCTLLLNSSGGKFEDLPTCTLLDICCVIEQQRLGVDCNCPAACSTTAYEVFNSYSGFPAQYVADDLNAVYTSQNDLVSVNVYFETLNIETQTTSDAYGPVALLSDLGGQLGLFLGVSVISIMEFVVWIVDEFKSRVIGDKLQERNLCQCCRREKQTNADTDTELPNVVHKDEDKKA